MQSSISIKNFGRPCDYHWHRYFKRDYFALTFFLILRIKKSKKTHRKHWFYQHVDVRIRKGVMTKKMMQQSGRALLPRSFAIHNDKNDSNVRTSNKSGFVIPPAKAMLFPQENRKVLQRRPRSHHGRYANGRRTPFANMADGGLPGPDPPFIENCEACNNSGFVACATCDSQGVVRNERSGNVFFCPDCVGHKKLRCPSCGGKCYMCE